MKLLRIVVVGACLTAGATALLAQGQPLSGRRNFKGNDPPGVVNAPPAKGERYPETLKVGDPAPDFTLPDVSSGRQITLSKSRGQRPVVLIFGSCTCPPFRRQIGEVQRIYRAYKDQADLFLVYIREAHPGSQIPGINGGQPIHQTQKLAERMKLAADFAKQLRLTLPVLADKEDNKVNAAYAAWPNRLVLVGVDGRVAYLEKPGPGFMPGEAEKRLRTLLGWGASDVARDAGTR